MYLNAAANFIPPSTGNATEVDLVAATPSAAQATGVGDCTDRWISLAVSQSFNVLFGTSSVANPADTAVFPAGVYSFVLSPTLTHFKVTASATAKLKYWRSSRT